MRTKIKKMQIIGADIVAFDEKTFNKMITSMKCIVSSIQTHVNIRNRYSAAILKQDINAMSEIIKELEV